MMIQVLARKNIRFKNPNASLVNPAARLGETDQVKLSAKYEDVYVSVIPNVVTVVPDWVKGDPIWGWCVEEGTLVEIATKVSTKGADLSAEGEQQLSDKTKKEAREASEKAKADLAAKLAKMSKPELIEYAQENHDLGLGPSMKKEDLLAAIAEAEKQKDNETTK